MMKNKLTFNNNDCSKAFTPGCGAGCFSPWKAGRRFNFSLTTAITTTKYRQLVTLNYKPHPAATEKSPAVNSFYDKKQHEKLIKILLAYKSSRADNEDIVDTWLKSLMSDLTTKATATRPKPLITRPIMILRYLEIVFGIK